MARPSKNVRGPVGVAPSRNAAAAGDDAAGAAKASTKPKVRKTGSAASEKKRKLSKAKRRAMLVAKDIKKCQAAEHLLTSRAAIKRVVRDIAPQFDTTGDKPLRFQPDAITAMCVATETALVELMARANTAAVHVGGREGPLLRDFLFAVSTFPHLLPGGRLGG